MTGDAALADDRLPAVAHLTGPGAQDVLAAAVDAAGGELHDVVVRHVQYRPGTDLVVRYRCDVTWPTGRRTDDVLLAAATAEPLPGTVEVRATDVDGSPLSASVWRYPFDPRVPGLEEATTPGRARDLLAAVGDGDRREVVSYRPTERAVVRVTGSAGRAYCKALPPAEVPALVARHAALARAGAPVAPVLAHDAERGLVVLGELAGPTLRDRIVDDLGAWPSPAELDRVLDAVAAADPGGARGRPGRVVDARGHARMLRAVLPDVAPALDDVVAALADHERAARARRGPTVHGDLHEGQLVVGDDGTVTGLLDVDDLGPGDPVEDRATLVAHLRFRAATLARRDRADLAGRVSAAAGELADAWGGRVPGGRAALDGVVAAVLVGLATGPFRIQRTGWEDEVRACIADAADLLDLPPTRPTDRDDAG